METLQFESIIELHDINPYVLVLKEQAEKIKPRSKKPIPILVQINSKPDVPWSTSMVPKGDGNFYLYLHNTVRKASNTKVGDKVNIILSFESSYKNKPSTSMNEMFNEALNRNKKAKSAWDDLIPSRKKEILSYFFKVKSKEGKERNLKRIIESLTSKRKRY